MAKQVKKAQRRPMKKATKKVAAKKVTAKKVTAKKVATKKQAARKVTGAKAATRAKSQPKNQAKRRFAKSDPILTEIIRNGVLAVTEEMKSNLMRTAYNMIIYEALDFTVGLYTPEGDTISIGLGLPMFIRGMAETVRAKLRHFGKDGLQEGDILVTNDAYLTGSHLNHFTFSLPIFFEGELCGFACCMAHWPDVGGTLGGVTTDIYSEGIQIPIVKYQRAGVVNQDLVDIIRMNVRLPDRAMGDLRAQITAVKTGERRFKELLGRYGREETLAAIGNIMAQSERSARARTREIPDGVYEATSYMDDDGVDIGKRVPIKVKVTVKGDEMTIDLTEVSAQVRGFYNSGETTGVACAQVAYKCLTSPTDYPINEGSFRTLNVALTKGTIISAVKPAPMRWWMTFPMTIVDTIFKALAPAVPDRVIAGHHADLLSTNLHGIHPRTGGFFMGGFGPLGGGWGAKMTEDGMSATVCLNDGDTHNSPVESVEAKFPFLIEELSLRSGSGGAGKFRGGLGIARKVSARVPLTLNAQVERMHCAPWGLEGGHDGFGNEVTVYDTNGEKRDVANAKVFLRRLQPGEGFYSRSGGGGGFGSPLARDPNRVAHDVAEEYVSAADAREIYGVVLGGDGTVDQAETQKLRATMGGKQA